MRFLRKFIARWSESSYACGYRAGGKDEWERYDFFEEIERETREKIAKEIEAEFDWNRKDNVSQMTRLGMLDRILEVVRGSNA